MGRKGFSVLALALLIGSGMIATAGLMTGPTVPSAPATLAAESLGAYHPPLVRAPMIAPAGFAFVSNFEDGTLDGWTTLSGSAAISTATTYSGEPSLELAAGGSAPGVVRHALAQENSTLSFQVAIAAGAGAGYLCLVDGANHPVMAVGVSNGNVVAGADIGTATVVEAVPTGTAYPSGWVYLTGNLFNVSTKSSVGWALQFFVDRTDLVAANLSLPNLGSYAAAALETTSGTAFYSNVIVTTYGIPTYLPGYNNMMGYGQGSGLVVQLLPAYTTVSAEMVLHSWDTPQAGILSFQINALNLYGTTRSSCVGFYQLGIDLNPDGMIAPWWVNGRNCIAHYFQHSMNAHILPGIASPAETHLLLSITDNESNHSIDFQIVDTSVAPTAYFNASVPYSGTEFYGMYTQMEWQPCCSNFPIAEYQLNAALYHLQLMDRTGATIPLKSDYMVPFVLDAPPSWNFGYYDDTNLGYQQLA